MLWNELLGLWNELLGIKYYFILYIVIRRNIYWIIFLPLISCDVFCSTAAEWAEGGREGEAYLLPEEGKMLSLILLYTLQKRIWDGFVKKQQLRELRAHSSIKTTTSSLLRKHTFIF